jgi:hypothetical protein
VEWTVRARLQIRMDVAAFPMPFPLLSTDRTANMPRTKTKTRAEKIVPAPSTSAIARAANRAKQAAIKAGLDNVREAVKFCDIASRPAKPYVPIGFCNRLVSRPFSDRETKEFETVGRKVLLALGVDDNSATDAGERKGVVVSTPITHLDRLASCMRWV